MRKTTVLKVAFTVVGCMVFGGAWAFGIPAVMEAQPGSETALHAVKSQKTPEQVVEKAARRATQSEVEALIAEYGPEARQVLT